MQVLWRGNANTWECDELGHLNVRFYMAKAQEALGGLDGLAVVAGANDVILPLLHVDGRPCDRDRREAAALPVARDLLQSLCNLSHCSRVISACRMPAAASDAVLSI